MMATLSVQDPDCCQSSTSKFILQPNLSSISLLVYRDIAASKYQYIPGLHEIPNLQHIPGLQHV